MSTVKTDRRSLNIDAGAIARLLDRRRKLLRAMDAAVTQLALDVGVPAVGENVVTGEIDDGVATVDFVLPGPGCGRITRDDPKGPHFASSANRIGVARENDRFVAFIKKGTCQAQPD